MSAPTGPGWVVKLGGSLFAAPELPRWLDACSALRGAVAIVPGGGPYADCVRQAQQRWGFGDDAAHALALGAMEQYGRQLCAMRPGLTPAASPATLAAASALGLTPVWMPRGMVLADSSVAASWDVTSDSLAAWLALRLQARGLVLVKSVPIATRNQGILAETGVVDPAFPALAARLPRVELLHRSDWASLAALVGADRVAAGHAH